MLSTLHEPKTINALYSSYISNLQDMSTEDKHNEAVAAVFTAINESTFDGWAHIFYYYGSSSDDVEAALMKHPEFGLKLLEPASTGFALVDLPPAQIKDEFF